MDIREATADDVKEISRIYALSWKAAYAGIVPQAFLDAIDEKRWVEKFRFGLGNGTLFALMIFDGAVPAGCAAFGRSRDGTLPDWGEIVSVYLHPDYYGKGFGAPLLNETAAALKAQGYQNIYLWVLSDNVRARRFYEKHGFFANGDESTVEILGQRLSDLRYVNKR